MTRFIDVQDLAVMLKNIGTERFICTLADYIRADYLRWEEFEKSARVANHVPDGVIELMPIADRSLYGFKYVNGHPKNTRHKLLTVMAFGVLTEVSTGYPLLFSEFTLTTALRTAATSALMASALARPNARSMALIGNGAQSEFQALAFKAILGINEVRIYDIDPAASEKFIRNMAGVADLRIIVANNVADAVRDADIVTTVTADKNYATILTPEMIEPGMHINGVGGDCPGKTEIHADILRAAKVFVEFEPQTRIEGDIQQLAPDFPVTEMWRVLNGSQPGRETQEQVTVFDSVGFAIEDFSALRYLFDEARRQSIGRTIALIPTLANPKDLYSLCGTAPQQLVSDGQMAEHDSVRETQLATCVL